MNHPITPLTGNWGSLTPNHNQIKLTPICTIPTFSDSEAMLISLKSSRMGWWVIYLLMARQTRPAVKKKVNRKPLRYISDPFCGRGSLPGFNNYNVLMFKNRFFLWNESHICTWIARCSWFISSCTGLEFSKQGSSIFVCLETLRGGKRFTVLSWMMHKQRW